jgi:hypothetical protein
MPSLDFSIYVRCQEVAHAFRKVLGGIRVDRLFARLRLTTRELEESCETRVRAATSFSSMHSGYYAQLLSFYDGNCVQNIPSHIRNWSFLAQGTRLTMPLPPLSA